MGNSARISIKDPRACVNRPGAGPSLSKRSDECSVTVRKGHAMRPYDNVPFTTVSCGRWGADSKQNAPK
jgi:hypothetical protein